MTQYPITQPPPPSWVRPIALGSSFAMFAQVLPLAFSAVVPAASPAVCCCCGLETIPMGLLPAWIAKRQDPTITAGQGFVVSFIAVGIASVIVALVIVLQSRGVDVAAQRAEILEQLRTQPLPQEEKVAMADMLVSVLPYVPVMIACVVTLLGGIWGMVGTHLGAQRSGPPTPPPPPRPPGAL